MPYQCPHKHQVNRGNQLECDDCGAVLETCKECWRGRHDECTGNDDMPCECNHTKDARS